MCVLIKIVAISILLFAQSLHCKQIDQISHLDDISDGKLIFAQTLCRHGHRNIYKVYPNDPWKAEEYWPGGYAQLTKIGKQQQYELGQYLRKRYASLLGNGNYSPNKVYVRTTDVDRTIASSLANLAGLFPPKDSEIWSDNLQWQPLRDDFLLAGEKRCDRFDYFMLQYMNGSEYRGWFKEYREQIAFLEKNSGMKLPTMTKIFDLFDTLHVEKLNGKRLPDFAEKVVLPGSDFESLALNWFKIFTSGSNELKMLKSGYLLKEIFDRFTNKIKSKLQPDRSLWKYFAHDITLANTLNSLGLFKTHAPPFASCIFFELYKANDTLPYVQIIYRNSTATDGVLLEIPNCGVKCPLQNLYDLYDSILPTQSFDKACNLHAGESLPVNGNPENSSL